MTTVSLTVSRGSVNSQNCYSILRKYWDPRVGENVRNMKELNNGSGVVFDIRSDKYEAFIDNYERLMETEGRERINFNIVKCKELPDLIEEDSSFVSGGGNWRD